MRVRCCGLLWVYALRGMPWRGLPWSRGRTVVVADRGRSVGRLVGRYSGGRWRNGDDRCQLSFLAGCRNRSRSSTRYDLLDLYGQCGLHEPRDGTTRTSALEGAVSLEASFGAPRHLHIVPSSPLAKIHFEL